MFFSTSSPIKGKQRADHCSLDASLLSPDSSYVCYPAAEGGAPCSCRRSTRLLLNGYYGVSEDSFSRDEDGNVSLTPCTTSVSYKENPVRVFRRRRRPRGALARLLSDVTESCQSWLDERVFRGVFGRDRDQDQDQDQDRDQDREGPASLDEPSWSGLNSTELDDSRHFTYDHSETPPPPDKVSPPPSPLRQEEICSEMCQSNELITQSLGGLSEVPPPSADYSCCPASPERTGLTMKAPLLLIFILFIFTAVHSGCPSWSATITVASAALAAVSALMLVTRSGPMSKWRKARTEDITSGNE